MHKFMKIHPLIVFFLISLMIMTAVRGYIDHMSNPTVLVDLQNRLETSKYVAKKIGDVESTYLTVPRSLDDSSKYNFKLYLCNADSCIGYLGVVNKTDGESVVEIADSSSVVSIAKCDSIFK